MLFVPNHIDNSLYSLIGVGALIGAYLGDMFSSVFYAKDNSIKFIEYIKETPRPLKEQKQDYKDPVRASTLSLLFTGAGYFYLNDYWGGIRSMLISSLVTGLASGIAFLASDKSLSNMLSLSIPVYFVCKLIDIYGCTLHADKINEEHYKQLLCPNSPYRLKEKKDEKNIALGLLLSFAPIPELGNIYAEDYSAAVIDIIYTTIGLGMFLGINATPIGSQTMVYNTEFWLKYTGLLIVSRAYISNLISVPNKLEIWNTVYAGKKHEEIFKEEVNLSPVLIKDGFGLQLSCSFK